MNTGTTGEIVGAGFWIASGIAVAGYTWTAYKVTYRQFPGMSGSAPSATMSVDFAPGKVPKTPLNQITNDVTKLPGVHQVAKANAATENWLSKLPVIGGINKAVFNWVNGL